MNGETVLRRCLGRETAIIVMTSGCALLLSVALVKNDLFYFGFLFTLTILPAISKWPIACSLGLYALLVPFDSITALGGETSGPTLTRLIGACASGILILVAFLGRRRFVGPPRAALWWLLFTAWGAFSLLWAVDAETVVERLPTSISLFLVYLVAVSISVEESELSSICTMSIVGGALATAYVIYAYKQGIVFIETSGRASLIAGGRGADPNQFAMSLLLPLGLAMGEILAARRGISKVFYGSAALFIAGGLFLTMSRGNLIALAVMTLTYLIRSKANWRIWAFVIAGIVIVTGIMPEGFFERLSTLAETGGAGRLSIWLVGLQALREHFVFGAGLSNFPIVYNRYVGFDAISQGDFLGSHNIYLGIWVELGIVGLVLMIGAFWSQIRSIGKQASHWVERQRINCIAVECACYGALVSGLFLDIVWRKAFWLPWILLALHTNHQDGAKVVKDP